MFAFFNGVVRANIEILRWDARSTFGQARRHPMGVQKLAPQPTKEYQLAKGGHSQEKLIHCTSNPTEQIGVETNNMEVQVAKELEKMGVPKTDIALGFCFRAAFNGLRSYIMALRILKQRNTAFEKQLVMFKQGKKIKFVDFQEVKSW
ncbi:MAG: element excision factor XisI family protein [Saprospiraceae bacterium]